MAQHRVTLFQIIDGSLVFDDNGQAVVNFTFQTPDLESAEKMYRHAVSTFGTTAAASFMPAHQLFDDLPSYLHALNFEARVAKEYPKDGVSHFPLTEDLDHWSEMGVETLEDLRAHLDAEFEREMRKQAFV